MIIILLIINPNLRAMFCQFDNDNQPHDTQKDNQPHDTQKNNQPNDTQKDNYHENQKDNNRIMIIILITTG